MTVELTENRRNKDLAPIRLSGITDIPGRAREVHELIARRAYAIYEGRGHIHGHDIEDWLLAKSEVVSPLCVGFMELNGDLKVDIGIRKSELPQLQVAIEPWRLIVSGKRTVPGGGMAQSHSEARPEPVEIFEVVNFPVQVEPWGAKTRFSNGLLEVSIPKAGKAEKYLAAKAA